MATCKCFSIQFTLSGTFGFFRPPPSTVGGTRLSRLSPSQGALRTVCVDSLMLKHICCSFAVLKDGTTLPLTFTRAQPRTPVTLQHTHTGEPPPRDARAETPCCAYRACGLLS